MKLRDNEYFVLLRSYCDRLVQNQITELDNPHFYGAVLCPACMHSHGRIADAVYPLFAMYDYTSDEKYLDCARRTVEWSEYNLTRTHGGYYNDKLNPWIGTSVFTSISFGEALLLHGKAVPKELYSYVYGVYVRVTDFVKNRFIESNFRTNVNYFAAYSAAMAIAYRLTGNEEYAALSRNMTERVLDRFVTEDGLVLGEGLQDTPSPKGFFGIDIGYNTEETLPAFSACAHYLGDEKLLSKTVEMWKRHLEFMIPDGGIDNSFGSRHDKWTYYGSRTSDGIGTGLCYLWDKDPIFAEAARRNFELIRECSKDGYLYGGRMYIEAGEEPCLHHSFAHAKALAAMIDHGFAYSEEAKLPRDEEYGLKSISSIGVELVSLGKFRATVSGYDAFHHYGACTGGGCMTLLWHEDVGAIFAATMSKYERAEPYNMQHTRRYEDIPCLSMRVQSGEYSSVNAKDAKLSARGDKSCVSMLAVGKLQNEEFLSSAQYTLSYEFTRNAVEIRASAECEAELILPVICGADGVLKTDGTNACVERGGATIRISADSEISCRDGEEKCFNPVGGFIASILRIKIPKGDSVCAVLSVE